MTRGSTSEHARTSGVTFWQLSIMPLLKGGGKSPRLFKNLNLAAQVRFQFPHTSSVACHMPRSSKSDIKILYSATVREILSFFIPRNLLPSFRYFFAPSLLEAKAGQIPMPIVPNRRSSFGMSCAHCDNELIAPEWSEFRNERQVHHVWRCCECDCCFETIVDTKSIEDIMTRDDIFPALFVV
jgi:hypothetical protein